MNALFFIYMYLIYKSIELKIYLNYEANSNYKILNQIKL